MIAANADNFLLVLTTLPDRASAERLAALLVEQKLAACASVQAECQSIYRWQGAVESASEVPLQLKTTAARYPALEAAIRAAHPYDVPEIIALPISHGLPAYLSWLATETS
jgi:periplasmic divalent cation tolerance protein